MFGVVKVEVEIASAFLVVHVRVWERQLESTFSKVASLGILIDYD